MGFLKNVTEWSGNMPTRPEKKEINNANDGDFETHAYISGFNQCHDLDTKYIEELKENIQAIDRLNKEE